MLALTTSCAATILPDALAYRDGLRFFDLLAAYCRSGGLAPLSELAARRPLTGLSELSGAIAAGEVLSVQWAGKRWLPVFQFERGGIAVRLQVRLLLGELAGLMDEEDVAQWFVQPNPWLGDAAPLALLASDFLRVHDAARALRFACKN